MKLASGVDIRLFKINLSVVRCDVRVMMSPGQLMMTPPTVSHDDDDVTGLQTTKTCPNYEAVWAITGPFCSNPVPTSDSGQHSPRLRVPSPHSFKSDETK